MRLPKRLEMHKVGRRVETTVRFHVGWKMKNADGRTNEEVRRICRDINQRSNDRQQLQTLVVRLQDVLREERHETPVMKMIEHSDGDDPFDKIMVA